MAMSPLEGTVHRLIRQDPTHLLRVHRGGRSGGPSLAAYAGSPLNRWWDWGLGRLAQSQPLPLMPHPFLAPAARANLHEPSGAKRIRKVLNT
ncbi:hypothetical protein TRIUR3_07907 [Triticum urartu]|uniref:Uncharacterized protein n=1 Tax=Triticum urartu TaxID=4572 RepID=M8A4J3_TRIUA|nr:hypothetical protein TRIUR3_07907 [Triticum urartu]